MARLLLVDPDRATRDRLSAQLEGTGHVVFAADSGERALALASDLTFDLVLLEVLLPGAHGFEIAARLKQAAGDRSMPIVMVTTLRDASSRALAFRSGADEFLTLPVDTIELRTRIESLLARGRDREALRAANLALIEQQRAKEEMATLLVHDLKSPLTAALINLDLLRAGTLPEPERGEVLEETRLAALRILRLVRNLLDVARIEAERWRPRVEIVTMRVLFDDVLEPRRAVLRHRKIEVVDDDGGLAAPLDRDLMGRALENIVDNALRHVPDRGTLSLRAIGYPDRLELRLGNSGPSMPAAIRAELFDKFACTHDQQRSNVGLGLYFSRLAIAALGGELELTEDPGLPVVFAIDLPAPPVNVAAGTKPPGAPVTVR